MAQRAVELDLESFSCCICLNLLEDPVTIPCGHSYCMSCINCFWEEKLIHSCPQCRSVFTPRPPLLKNTMLAVVVEQLKQLGCQTPDCGYAGETDVACDVCTGVKLKAVKSCLVCLVSYCGKHLQPHYESATFQKHKLVEPSKTLQENICSHHHEVMRMFCRTDQQLICYICPVDEHKGHDTVSAAAERTERQKKLIEVQQNIQQRIQEREKDFQMLEEEVEAVTLSADKAVNDIDRFFNVLIQILDQRCSDGREQVRVLQDNEVSRARGLQEKLQMEIIELKRRNDELKELFLIEDHNHFLHSYPSLSGPGDHADSPNTKICPLKRFEDMTGGLSKVQQKLQSILGEDWSNIPDTATAITAEVSPAPMPQPKSRADFLVYSCNLTLDPDSAHPLIILSHLNRRATYVSYHQQCDSHSKRFLYCCQVLSRERMAGRCYWEVSRKGRVYVALSYGSILRKECYKESCFGLNSHSWALQCKRGTYTFYHNSVPHAVSPVGSSRIGVYLDHSAGILSFYSISQTMTMTLLHSIQTEFTQPLHAGLCFYNSFGDMAEFCTFSELL